MLTLNASFNAMPYMDIPSDKQLAEALPCDSLISQHVQHTRQQIQKILCGEDDRLMVVVGPCSIHDPKAALEYAEHLILLSRYHADDLFIVMRTYFEKPRTTVGWKGFINDPDLNGSFDIGSGLTQARELLLKINALNLATATEFLCPKNALYIADLISWGAIGARTTESQIHRELASGLPCPIGFKNNVDGNIQVAIDAMHSVRAPHFICMPKNHDKAQVIKTPGNQFCHVVLRGGKQPNYFPSDIQDATQKLTKQKLPTQLMIDCSHGNSQKKHKNQLIVGESLCQQISQGKKNIAAVMIESFLEEGRQDIQHTTPLNYGQSVTDACIHWQDTKNLLNQFAKSVRTRRKVHTKNNNSSSLLLQDSIS